MSDYTRAKQRWQTPDPAFSPAPIWWWSGDRLEPARLRWQLERFAEGGVYNLVILNLAPTGPLHGSRADDPAFLTPEWWAIFRGVCRDAHELGIKLWFYDQIGFSGANLQGQLVRQQPAFVGQQLQSSVQAYDRPAMCAFPDGAIPLGAWQITAAGEITPLTVHAGHVQSHAESAHRVRLVYAVKKGFDYMSVTACAALRATVHEAFEREVGDYFGSVIVGSFQDELPSMPTWSADFAQSFAQALGYDVDAHLIALFEGDDAHSQQVRIDYQQWRARRSERAFFQPFYEWHEQHGLICGFDQQSPARMALPIGAVDEYADYMQTHRWYGAPGSDHHGNGKIHSSMAHLYQRPRSWIEAFHSSGWGGTLEETFDWLVPWLRAGLTLYDPHAVYYSTRGGWWEWAPPSTCWRQPYWRHYRHFAEAVMRVTGLMSLGRHVCDIAVLFPTTTVQAHLPLLGASPAAQRAERVFVEITGSMFWNNPQPGVLERVRRDFDMLDDASLERASIQADSLCIADERYRCLILPGVTHLTPACVHHIHAFVAAGGLVVAVETMPDQLATLPRVVFVAHTEELAQILDRLPRRVDGDLLVLERMIDDVHVCLVTPTVSGSQFAWNGHWNSTPYDFDAQRLPSYIDVVVSSKNVPSQWCISDGSIVPIMQNADGSWRVSLQDAPIAVIVFDDQPPAQTVVERPIQVTHDLAGTWRIEVVPTLDNQWGDFARPASPALLEPHTMRFDTTSGTLYVQGFDTYGWYIGPLRRDLLPEPYNPRSNEAFADATWQPLVYSLQRGIYKDTLHWGMLGPKGYVPEEFMHFGMVTAGDAVRVRTTVTLQTAFAGAFVVAAAATKRVWLDGVLYDDAPAGYQWFIDVTWLQGRHSIEFELVPEQTLNLRGYWSLVHAHGVIQFARPNWIMQADTPQTATYLHFSHTFTLAHSSSHAQFMVVADVPIRVLIDDVEIGRQGGFDPYGSTVRIQSYDVGALNAGNHMIAIEALDAGRGVSLLVDGVLYAAQTVIDYLMTGAGWHVTRQGGDAKDAVVRRRQWVDLTFDTDHALYVDMDPGWPLMWRRQHPLPQAHWLEDAPANGTVFDVVPHAFPQRTCTKEVTWRIPATASQMLLPFAEPLYVHIDNREVVSDNGIVQLPAQPRTATMTLTAREGDQLLAHPIRYVHQQSEVAFPADFATLGFADYSGAVRFVRTWQIDDLPGTWIVDLGRVRGTVAVRVNGVSVGVRIWSPYQFDLTGHLIQGLNSIEIEVTNTMASYLAAHSPSHYTPPYQQVSGVYGPVTLIHHL
ncbi:MAG: hypothetical protein FJ040_05830 [Chloroflexi bacterium]|nr:hypothetical protein [Chloroflexota bacterium]